MTTPELLYQIETQILDKIVSLLVSGDIDKPAGQWQLERLADLGKLNHEVQAVIDKYREVIKSGTYTDIEQTADNVLKDINRVIPQKVTLSPAVQQTIESWVNSANGDINLALAKLAEQGGAAYVNAINKAVLANLTGENTLQQSIEQATTDAINSGIDVFTDTAGRKWTPESYSRMLIRTNQRRVATDIMFNAADDLGTDLIGVSSHLGARELCAPYQGRVFSRTGRTPNYPLWSETSYGQAAGLLGINCGHNIYPVTPGMKWPYEPTADMDKNAEQYEQSQKQRKIERAIRDSKRKAQLYETAGDTDKAAQYKQKTKDYQQAMRDFIDETGRTRRRDREQIYGKK